MQIHSKNIHIKVIIPAFNEEGAVGQVIKAIPKGLVEEVIVVNNASTDQTAAVAQRAGATVLLETRKGYGSACLKGIAYIRALPVEQQPDIVVFLDADYSDFPEEMPKIVNPITIDNYDMVIGSRALGQREKGSMTFPQIFGNWLATNLLYYLYDIRFTDLGPFRAIKWEQLLTLNMEDTNFGWTVEMQAKAAKKGLKCCEVAVNYRKRGAGKSKVSGTIKGTILAGYKILWTIFKYWR